MIERLSPVAYLRRCDGPHDGACSRGCRPPTDPWIRSGRWSAVLRNFRNKKREWESAARRLSLQTRRRFLQVPDLQGVIGNVQVRVAHEASVDGSKDETSFTGNFPSLNLGLKVTVDNSFKRSIRKLKRADDTNPAAGENLRIRGNFETIVKDFMTPQRMSAAGVAIAQHQDMKITDTEISFTVRGRVKTAEEIVSHVNLLTQTAEVLLNPTIRLPPVVNTTVHSSVVSNSPIHSDDVLPVQPTDLTPEPFSEPTREKTAQPPSEPMAPVSNIDAQAVAEEMFLGTRVSFVVEEAFETQYAGQRIRWQGTVRSMRPYTADHHFGETPGVKIVAMIAEVTHDLYGRTKIDVVAALPQGTPLIDKGDPVTITATLDELDVPKRSIYLKNATLG